MSNNLNEKCTYEVMTSDILTKNTKLWVKMFLS